MTSEKININVQTTVPVPVEKAWELWTKPEHITHWNFASDDWHCPAAENDVQPGGQFSWRMEARDGSMGFDYAGQYEAVEPNKRIASVLGDGRKVNIEFSGNGNDTSIDETFEAENMNPVELQRGGWQAILDNFKKYAETQK